MRLIFEAEAGDQADQLLSLPWEILYIPALRTHVGLIPRVTIVRRLLETVRQAAPLISPPFRVVHVVANTAAPLPIAPELQAIEGAAIRRAVGWGEHYTLVATPGSVERFQDELGRRPSQIIHFLGHGAVDTLFSQQSYLLFEGGDGRAQLVPCEQLPRILGSSPSTQLVVLNACHGASVEAANNVALQLVYYGVPYIVAMQGEVSQQAAAVFAQTFYAALQKGVALEEAVAMGRMKMAELPGSPDWCLPTLFVSAGKAAPPTIARATNTVERWLSQPAGQRQLGNGNIALGAAHLVVALLILLSGAAPPLPALGALLPLVGLMAPLPPLLAIAARWTCTFVDPIRPTLQRPASTALLLRIIAATALGLGLVAFYGWLVLLLVAAMGFWALLSPLGHALLLATLFAPSLLVSWQQAQSHATGFLSNNTIAEQKPDLRELVVFAAGYLLLCGPLALLWAAPEMAAPPLGNFAAAILLIALGFQLRKQSA